MEENYEQRTSAIGSLRSILQSYPFSVGIFREILQNSDDAGASKQIFVLDRRNHAVVSLNHANLASTQGPALLAYNDALFKEADWESLKHAFESSKSDDSSKIGKYGIGFRSVYHITDCPQILSGSFLTISDPLKSFTDTYGKRINLAQSFSTHTDQLSSFDWFFNHGWKDNAFEGTIIRCPLRNIMSKISAKIVRADEISQLFHDFVTEEIDISLLFLQNVTSIEIYEVDEQGKSTCVATSVISRSASTACGDGNKTYKSFVTKNSQGKEHEKVWRLLHCPFPQEEAVAHLAKRQINNPSSTLKEHKLVPNVSLAFPLSIITQAETGGRLFTFLPLPLKTGFPAHVHALFALTQSRQHLRNSGETGIVSQAADHVVIEWNKLLFDEFIPRAWRVLLEVLVQADGIMDVFRAWPNKQPITLSGDTVYWQSLPTRVLHFIVSSGSPVWPVYSLLRNSPMEYKVLDELITSQSIIPESVLRSLTTMGLKLTRPPAYLVDEIKNLVDPKYVILTPETAHDALLNVLARLTDVPWDDTSVVLEYLLSTNDVLNIVGLPFIKTVSERVAILTALDSQPPKTYTMLDPGEFSVFGSCDPDSIIALRNLPPDVGKSLQSRGPKFINVENLGSERIAEYLTLYPSGIGRVQVVRWLSKFWVWMSTYSDRTDLYSKIKHLFILPTTNGLKTAETVLFKSRGEHPLNIQHLSSLGIVFLDAGVTEAAQTVIASHGILKIINQDIHTLLDSLPSDPSTLTLDKGTPSFILKFISARVSAACASHGLFSEEQIQRLKKLPIYPVFVSSNNTSPIFNWTSIPDGYSIKTISRPGFLPVIEKIVFVEAKFLTSSESLLDILQPDQSHHLFDVQFLTLTFEHFTVQSTSLQAVILQDLVHRQRQLPPSLFKSLVEIAFVVSIDGLKRKPGEVVDPASQIACLFEGDSARQVRTDNGSEQAIVKSLQSMRLMQHALTISMIEERIGFISANHSSPTSINLSRLLLEAIQSTHFDCSNLSLVPGQKWLPADRGLCVPEECRDGERNCRNLFDEVLGVLEQGIQIPHSLRSVFKWDRPIETVTIIKQLDQVLNKIQVDDMHEKVVDIIKELSGRDCSDSDLVTLRSITAERKWVPTSRGQLARTVDVVFSPNAEAGFEQILYISIKARKFLFDLGCSEEPSRDAILMKLNALSNTGFALDSVSVKVAVNLLSILPSMMSDEEHAGLLIPDAQCILRPHSEIYFNDIAERAYLIPAENHFIAHGLVDDTLARKLNLARLGLRFVDLKIPGVDMGEKPLTTVRNTLRQYTEQQFVTEFVANACDANATKLTFLVNEFCSNLSENTRLLSPAMQKFFNCPSLVVYNNAKFSEEDFTGICRTSVGGKEGKSNTIGQFGLGALTMFHITELAIVVSNAHVLFLNPSKEHLPTSDRAALKISLNHIRQFYPDHLSSINGLFGFDASSTVTDPYDGTIFILPLRAPSHCPNECASDTMWTANNIQQKILEPFEEVASNCLLFTKIEELCSVFRNADGIETISWSTGAERIQELVEEETGYSTSNVKLLHISTSETRTSYWKTASATVSETQIPPKLLSALEKQYRLRIPAIVGLAASLDDTPPKTFNFFSTLPLAIKTTLPVHIMASFLLSADRRQIRLDEFNNPETEYNRWLLSSIIPPLYLFLLETFPSGDNARCWPGRNPHAREPITQILIKAFFSVHLKRTERRVFRSMFNAFSCLSSKDCVLFYGEPCVKKVLSFLRSDKLVKLPRFITLSAAEESKIPIVDPLFLRIEILRDPSVIPSAITSVPEPNFKELEDLIGYLAGKGDADRDKSTGEDSAQVDITNLIDLPLLPLADGTFGTFQSNACPTYYFVWTSRRTSPRPIFPLNRLVHPQLKPKSVLKLDLNVSSLNSDVIKAFVEARLSRSPVIEDAPQDIREWIQDFWVEYPFLDTAPLQPDDIFEFPLVPTIRPSCFVSLEECSSGSTCIFRGNSQEQVWNCLNRLGLTVVQADSHSNSESLIYIFNSRMDVFPESKFERILSAMNVESPTVLERFSNLDADSQRIFASWARPQICSFVDDLSQIAQELPIWEVARPGEELELHAASEILMLPEGLSIEIASRFKVGFVAEWGNLRYLNGPKLTFVEGLEDQLDLPTVLRQSDLQPYKELLTIWISHLPFGYGSPLPVPNSVGDMIMSNMLYAREELFEAAFGVESVHIPAIEFQELENSLYRCGLQGTNGLDMAMFTACAEATHHIEEDEDRVRRAEIVFRAYCVDLPLRAGQDPQSSWSNLDHLRFIPRNMGSVRRLEHHERRMELDIPQHLQDLADVVCPNELVRKQFESIAWTQRASFLVQPDQRILMVNPGLGLPNITEVISHLSALSSYPVQSRLQRQIIIHDMVETLKWLNENVVDSNDDILYDLQYENIFLNVDDPSTEPWIFTNANELAFEAEDIDDGIRYVREFLLPYDKLLRAAGVVKVFHPQCPVSNISESASATLQSIRTGFNDLRRKRLWTDVVFVTSSARDDDDTGIVPSLVAHRSFLTAFSDYFSDSFCGEFREANDASSSNPILFPVERSEGDYYSADCVQMLLDHIYTGDEPPEDSSLDLLLEALELSGYWRLEHFFEEVQRTIVKRRLINPSTLDEIRETAERVKAELLLQQSQEYEEKNAVYIRKVRFHQPN